MNLFLSQRCDLHDTFKAHLLILSLIDSSASIIQAYLVLLFPILRQVSPRQFTGVFQCIAAGIGTSNFLRSAFIVSLNTASSGSMKFILPQLPSIIELRFLDSPPLLRFPFRCTRRMFPHIWPHIVWTRGCLFPRKSPPGPCVSHQVAFRSKSESCEACPLIRQFFFSIHVPVIFNIFSNITSSDVCVFLVTSMYLSGIGKCFFSRHVLFDLVYNVMTINEFSCDRPEVIFSFLIITGWVFLKMGWVYHSSELPSNISGSSPRSGWFRVKVVVLRRCSPPKILTVPSATGKMKFPLLCGVNTSFALGLRAWSSDASISSNSSISATLLSPFQILSALNAYPKNIPGKTFGPNWCSRDMSLAEIGWCSTNCSERYYWSVKWHSEPPLYGVFPSD